jgi:hypothetical protein
MVLAAQWRSLAVCAGPVSMRLPPAELRMPIARPIERPAAER